MRNDIKIVLLAIVSIAPLHSAARADDAALGGIDFFEKKVRPLLADNCYNCHSANTNAKGGLRLDDRNGMIHGGGRGPALDRKSTRLNSSHRTISYAVFCLKKKKVALPERAQQHRDLNATLLD